MPTVLARAAGWLPRGVVLEKPRWRVRHRMILVLLGLHVPALAAVAAVNGRGFAHVAVAVGALGTCLGVGVLAGNRRCASLAATVGLVAGSVLLVHFTDGAPETGFSLFVILGFVALYQDWVPYLTAVGGVAVTYGAVGTWRPDLLFADATAVDRPWLHAAVFGGALFAAALSHVAFWKLSEAERDRAQEYYRQLYEGERAVSARLYEAERVKSELVAVVSHEIRTPLTAIMGYARTLSSRGDRMDPAGREAGLAVIADQADRLDRIVENLLLAANGAAPGRLGTDLDAVVARAVRECEDTAGPVAVDVEPGLRLAVAPEAAAKVLLNLLDNAAKFATPDSAVRLTARQTGQTAVVEVANVGEPVRDGDRARIFEPFVQADSSDSRAADGLGLGLHIVRRLVESSGGSVEVRNAPPCVVFDVRLPIAQPHVPGPGDADSGADGAAASWPAPSSAGGPAAVSVGAR